MTREPEPATFYDFSAEWIEDWPAPAEERTVLALARPRVRFCRRRG
jgi:hypothetical protein